MQVALLGPLEVWRGGTLLQVPGGRTSELLARLAVDAGRVVRVDRLLEDLWAPDAVATRRNTLQAKVTKLRRALEDPQLIVTTEDGYRLDIDPGDVDALVVLEEAATASRLRAEGDAEGALAASTTALGRFRGDVLQAAAGEWADVHKTRLDATRSALLETQLAARLELGGSGDLIGELEVAVAESPYREALWELLITALYRSGRQVDALAAYQRVRELLDEELGLQPGPRLQALEHGVLRHDSALGAQPVAGQHATAPSGGNLPSLTVELIGREADVQVVAERLARKRLVEVVGPGGVGKTALALAVGRSFRSAGAVVWLARLETAVTAHDVIDVLVAAVSSPGEAALFERLKGSDALVILDNCEHVLDAAATLAVRLLDTGEGVRVLCTSQVPLDVDGEAVLELAPLALADAVLLFARRANAQRRSQSVSAAADEVEALCLALDGLPLAIELAAARTRTLSIRDITRRLGERLDFLHDPASRRPERRRSLKSTIGWSYDLLFPDDQRGLWALATFVGGASLPAVEAVLDALEVPAAAAIDVVGRLAGRSLVIVDDEGAAGPVRYRLLDSIRQFSLEAMREAGMSERARAAHAAWYAKAAATSTAGVRSSHQAAYLAFARTERANIDAALMWSVEHDPPLALATATGFGWAWVVLGDSKGASRLETALDAATDQHPGDRAGALLLAAWIEASSDNVAKALGHVKEATELAMAMGDVDLQARCLCYLAYVVSHGGDFQRALELTARSRTLYDGLDRPWDQAANALFEARAAVSAGDVARSLDARDHVAHWLSVVDDPWLHVRGEAALGELARLQHRFDEAVAHLAHAAESSRRLGFQQTEAYQVSSLGRAQCQAGDYASGAATLVLAIEKAEAVGDVRLAALVRVHLGRILRALGDTAGARMALEAASAWHRAAGGGEQAALGECLLAALDATEGAVDAEARLTAILEDARSVGAAHVEVFALDALARLAAEAGHLAEAASLCEQADGRMDEASHFITELDRCDAHAVRQLA